MGEHGGGLEISSEGRCRREISVLGAFRLRADGEALSAGVGGSQRLLAFLALQDRAVGRAAIAGTLWPAATDDHAHSSLRSALCRMPAVVRAAIVVTPSELCLAPGVHVDIRESRALAHRMLDRTASVDGDRGAAAVLALSTDVLPDWYDGWAIAEAEEWRQLRLHALEALAGWLTDRGRYGEALGAALAAVRVDTLRESARAAVIRVHVAEGNQSEALRELQCYRTVLRRELGLEPTHRLTALVGHTDRAVTLA